MRHLILTLLAALALACGGGGSATSSTGTTPPPPPPPPPPVSPTPIPAGTYTGATKPVPAIAGTTAPLGTMAQILIQTKAGSGYMELDGWNLAVGGIYVDASSNLQPTTGATMTNADGVTVPLTLTGTLTNGHMVGTANGAAFDLALTTIQDQIVDITTKAGTYTSTASSNGQVMVMTMTPQTTAGSTSCDIWVDAYTSLADATAATNRVCSYAGTLSYAEPTKLNNIFSIGFRMITWNGGIQTGLPGAVSGFAYFDTTGNVVVLTAQPNDNGQTWNKQLSGTFVKQ